MVYYTNNNKVLSIKNNFDASNNCISFFNVLGQSLEDWKIEGYSKTTFKFQLMTKPQNIFGKKTSKGIWKKIIIR
jgi:hypothetical protein